MQAVLADVGMLNDKGPDEARTAAANHFKVADTSNSGALSYEQFCKFYDTLVTNNAQQQLRFKMGLQVEGRCFLYAAQNSHNLKMSALIL